MRIEACKSADELSELLPKMEGDISVFYPGFRAWMESVVLPSFGGSTPVLLASSDDRIAGICIGKRTDEERKIRCLFVFGEFRNHGFAIPLVSRMLEILGDPFPQCSVPEELIDTTGRILVRHFGFSLSRTECGTYRQGKTEFFFNEKGTPKSPS